MLFDTDDSRGLGVHQLIEAGLSPIRGKAAMASPTATVSRGRGAATDMSVQDASFKNINATALGKRKSLKALAARVVAVEKEILAKEKAYVMYVVNIMNTYELILT
jgi:hypothetical protein